MSMYTYTLRDLIEQPDFDPSTQNNRGDWSLRDVSAGTVTADSQGKPQCAFHGAMNAVSPDRTLWRCLTCARATYVVVERLSEPNA